MISGIDMLCGETGRGWCQSGEGGELMNRWGRLSQRIVSELAMRAQSFIEAA